MVRLIHLFFKNRDAFAISILISGGSLNYALRDGIGIAPKSTAFSFLFIVGWMFFVLPFRKFDKIYYKKNPLTILAVVYLIMTMIYMYVYANIFRASTSSTVYDLIVIGVVWYFLFYLSFVKEEDLHLNFLNITMWIALIGSIGLIIYVMLNPNYILGQRMAISFSNESDSDTTGNPHIYARTAVFGVLSSLILLKYNQNKKRNILIITSLFISYAVLILSQAMSSILGAFLISVFYFYNNVTLGKIKLGIIKLLGKWYFWLILIAVVVKGIDLFKKNEVIIELGYRVIERRVEDLVNTFKPKKKEGLYSTSEVYVDMSAEGRMDNLRKVKEGIIIDFEETRFDRLIFGRGYFDMYVDVPIIEVFRSYGLFGLSIFSLLFFLMLRYCIEEMRRPTGVFNEFIAYGFLYYFVYSFTNGLIMDYNRWTYFILVIRFIPDLKSKKLYSSTSKQ
jgi:hypothetical protein